METLELIKRARSGDKLARTSNRRKYGLGIQHRETICGKRV